MTREQRAADQLLRAHGWQLVPRRGKGSHRVYHHPDGVHIATVPLRCDIRNIEKTIRQAEEHA